MKSLYTISSRITCALQAKLSQSLASNPTENLLNKFIFRTAGVVALFFFLGESVNGQTTVTYDQRMAHYSAGTVFTAGTAGIFNQAAHQLGMFANGGTTKQVVAWRTLKTAGDNTGTDRSLRVGDEFRISVSANTVVGEMGFALLTSPSSRSGWNDRLSNAAVSVRLSNYGNWYATYSDGTTANAATSTGSNNIGGTTSYKNFVFTCLLTAPNRMNITITDGTTTSNLNDVLLNNSNAITEYSIFLSDDWNGSQHRDIYWNTNSTAASDYVRNTLTMPIGGSNGSFTISGVLPDGLASNSTSTVSVNALTKNGTGNLTLSAANTFTGTTTINQGTVTLGAANALPVSGSAGVIRFATNAGSTLNLGLFNLGSSTEAANSAGALDFDVNTTINLGASGSNAYYFKASDGQIWNAATVTINNWAGTPGATGTLKIFIGNSQSLSVAQLAKITFTGFGTAMQLSTGEIVPATFISTGAISGTPLCAGGSVSVSFTYSPTSNFTSGTAVFTAQLSNSSGSFDSPVSIGTVNSDATGSQTISATIPSNTSAGSGYRIRVISANPSVTGTNNGTNVIINLPATANAGSAATICSGAAYTLTGASVGGSASTGAWSITGVTGTMTNASSQLSSTAQTASPASVTFTPISGNAGTVTLTLTTNDPDGACSAATSTVTLTVNSSVGGTATATSSTVCLNGSTSISLSGQTGATIQWQRSENSGSSWSNITGATSSSYTTTNLITTTSYRANVTNGSCSAAPSSAAAVSIVEANTSTASSATYSSAWSSSQNDNITGLGAWTLSAIGTAGFFTGSSDVNNGGSRSWGMFASGGSNVASAVRPVSLSVGNTLSFSMDNGSIDNGRTIGFALQNSNGQNLAELLFIGGQLFYQIIDAAGTTNTSIGYTAGGLDLSVAYTADNTYTIFVTGKGGATTSYSGRTFATQAGGQIPAQIRFFNAGAGTGSGYDLFFNSLSISNPVITAHPSNTAQNVCLNSSATALTVAASGTSLTYQWYSNANASASGGTLINSATSSSYTPSSAAVGTLYYYCVVTNGSCGSATSRVSGAVTVVTSTTSISPNNTQNISMSTSGTPLTVSTGTATVSSRAWKYSTTSGSGYEAFSPAQTGTTYTPNFATSGTFYVVCEVNYDNFCGVITSNEVQVTVVPNSISTASITGTQFCAGATGIAVPFTYAGAENFPSATFKAQLSNSNGSFVTPVDLQTVASNGTGSQSILITIPSSTANGTGYRIRVVSDNPVLNGTDNGVNLTINSPSVGGSVSGGATVCSGVNNTSLTLSGSTGGVTKWQSSTAPDFSVTVSDIANTTTSLLANNLTTTTYYRAVVTNGACASAISSTATITVNQPSVGGTVSGGSSICVGATSASLSLAGNTGTITKWQSAVSPFNSWTDIANTAGLSAYTSGALSQTTRFRAVVTNGVCSAANSAGASVTVDQSNADAGAYTSSWTSSSNDEVTGLNSWILQNTGASGYFVGTSDINVNGKSWGMFANTGGEANGIRPFASNLSMGATLNFSFEKGSVQSTGVVGFSLRNSSNQNLMEFYFTGGASFYTISDNAGVSLTTVPFTTSGLRISISYTAANTYSMSVTPAAGGNTTYFTGRTFTATGSSNQVPREIRFFNFNAGLGSASDFYLNSISLNRPSIGAETNFAAQNLCQNATASTLSVAAYGSGLSYQWYQNTSASTSGATAIANETNSSYTPSTASAGTLYYYCIVSGSCSSVRSNFSGAVTVNNLPSTPTAGDDSRCGTGTIVISATPESGQTIDWYASSTGGASLSAGSTSYTTPSISSTTTYFAEARNTTTGCVSATRTAVVATVNANPTALTLTGSTYCSNSPGGTIVSGTSEIGVNYSLYNNGTIVEGTELPGSGSALTWSSVGQGTSYTVVGINSTTFCESLASNAVSVTSQLATYSYYLDTDNDGYGAGSVVLSCSATTPAGYAVNASDCNNNNAAINPAAIEICGNNIDENCSGASDDTPSFYRSSADGNWGDASTWEASCTSNGTYTAAAYAPPTFYTGSVNILDGHDVVIPTGIIIYQTGLLDIDQGGSLTLTGNDFLNSPTTNGTTNNVSAIARLTVTLLIDNAGTLNIGHQASLVQTSTTQTNAGTGNINIESKLTGTSNPTTNAPNGRYWYLGSPMNNTQASSFFDVANKVRLWSYNALGNSWAVVIHSTSNPTVTTTNKLVPGIGYLYRAGASKTITYTGTAAADLNNNIIYNLLAPPTGESFIPLSNYNTMGYKFVANPYPSHIDWRLVTRSGLNVSYWIRNAANSGYEAYNATTNISTSSSGQTTRFIPPMQGFWVYAFNSSPSLRIDNTDRFHSTNVLHSPVLNQLVRLKLNNGKSQDYTVVYENELAANDLEEADTEKMFEYDSHQLYTLEDNHELALNGLLNATAKGSVEMGVLIPNAGSYTLEATDIELEEDVVLEDKFTHTFQDLKVNPIYSFTSGTGTFNERFVLHFTAIETETVGVAETEAEGVSVYTTTGQQVKVWVTNTTDFQNATVKVYDVIGNLIERKNMTSSELLLDLDTATGVYLVEVTGANKTFTQKVFIGK